NITAIELKELMRNGTNLCLLDVRNMEEFELGHIEGAQHIPLTELQTRLQELNRDLPLIAYCKSGRRSLMAVELLQQAGVSNLKNLKGGITTWAQQVDPRLPVY